jgi:hypothetical protein
MVGDIADGSQADFDGFPGFPPLRDRTVPAQGVPISTTGASERGSSQMASGI